MRFWFSALLLGHRELRVRAPTCGQRFLGTVCTGATTTDVLLSADSIRLAVETGNMPQDATLTAQERLQLLTWLLRSTLIKPIRQQPPTGDSGRRLEARPSPVSFSSSRVCRVLAHELAKATWNGADVLR